MQKLPDQVLLNIYFYIDDYSSLSQFFTLNKGVYYLMERYKTITQLHRMNVLKRNLFQFLDRLVTHPDDEFVEHPSPDLNRLYRLYKNAIVHQLACVLPLRYFLLARDDFANMVMISGEEGIEKILYMSVDVGKLSRSITIRLTPIHSNEPNDTQRKVIFDVVRNSKYKFVQLNYKYITRIFDSVF
jgi:hypothetical protein